MEDEIRPDYRQAEPFQMIQIELLQGFYSIRIEQPTKFPSLPFAPAAFVFISLIIYSSQSANQLIMEQLFHSTLSGPASVLWCI